MTDFTRRLYDHVRDADHSPTQYAQRGSKLWDILNLDNSTLKENENGYKFVDSNIQTDLACNEILEKTDSNRVLSRDQINSLKYLLSKYEKMCKKMEYEAERKVIWDLLKGLIAFVEANGNIFRARK